MAYVFNNTAPVVGVTSNWIGPHPADHELSGRMARAWIAFAASGDPNEHGNDGPLMWPMYSLSNPRNMLFKATGIEVENDDFRKEGMEWFERMWGVLRT